MPVLHGLEQIHNCIPPVIAAVNLVRSVSQDLQNVCEQARYVFDPTVLQGQIVEDASRFFSGFYHACLPQNLQAGETTGRAAGPAASRRQRR